MKTARTPKSSIVCPFTVAIDQREQAPYSFTELKADAAKRSLPLVVATQAAFLPSGDYSIIGCEKEIAIERKSLGDLYSTLGSGRERFEAEHERLSKLAFAAVVIEADWATIIAHPPERSRLNPKTVFRTALSWQVKYGVHWLAMGNRRLAEITVFRLLEKFWEQKVEREKEEKRLEQEARQRELDCVRTDWDTI